jgi:CheY-like chemotaxis protein
LTSGVAHDFNNLLMGVGGCVKLASKRLDPNHPAAPYLRRAAESILHGASLTRQILRFSDTRPSADGPIELDEVVQSARELVRSLLGEHVRLRVITEAPGVQIAADAGEIEQILMNLASNARDAMPDGGSLTFRTCSAGDRVELTVSDTGSGMPESVRARAFEPFFTTKEIGRGTGLGLATVFAVAARLGGKVSIDSAEGHGTSIAVSLPIAVRTGSSGLAEAATAGGGKRVLLVENDALVRMTVENQLETLGCHVLSAESVSEAMMLLDDAGDPVDLAIVDVMMPCALGTKLQELLAARHNPLPILFISAHARSELVRHFGLPANAKLLSKPFDAAALGKALTDLCGGAPQPVRTRVFIVEDNVDIADSLREILESRYDVHVAYDGAEAVRAIREFEPDLVLCDLELGLDMHGCDVVRALAGDPRLAHTRYLALTGRDPCSCQEQAKAAGFDRVLGKPLDLDHLMELLE